MKKTLAAIITILVFNISALVFSQESTSEIENNKNPIEYKSTCLDYFEKWNTEINDNFKPISETDPSDDAETRKQLETQLRELEAELETYKKEFTEFQETGNCKITERKTK